MKLKQKITSFLAITFLCMNLTACFEEKQAVEVQKLPPVPVKAITMNKETLNMTGEYMGQALGFLSVEVRAQVSGILLKRYYKRGDFVKKGQLLFEIDPSQAEAAYNQAKAKLSQSESAYQNAKREWERIIPLYKKNAVSQRDRDQSEAAYLSAKANVEAAKAAEQDAKINLGYTKVTAPISGYTSLDALSVGNLISLDSSSSLLTIINQTDPMYVNFSFPGSELIKISRLAREGKAEMAPEGAKAEVVMMDGTLYPEEGKISFIDTQINPKTNTLQARAEFPNPNGALIPNMFTKVKVYGTKLKDVLVLPQKAVLQTAKGPMVYVIDKDNIAQLKPVTLGDSISSLFLIKDGLEVGDVVVIEGINKIHTGSEVVVQLEENILNIQTSDDVLLAPNNLNTAE